MKIMNWIKKYGILVLLIVVIVILTPIALHILIFENTYPSKVSNDGWAGFFGGYIGAIIGALATIIAIKLELNDNKKQRKIEAEEKYKDEIKNLRPYLCFHETNYVTDEHGLKLTLDVKNVGFHAACDISIYKINHDKNDYSPIYNKHTVIGAGEIRQLKFNVDLEETEFYQFRFDDIRGDSYKQDIQIVHNVSSSGLKLPEYFSTSEPELDETKEEKEERINSIRVTTE